MESGDEIDVMAMGEAMILVTPVGATSLEGATKFALETSGAEANVASHVAALGGSAAWVGRLGDDPLGHRISADLASRGVDTQWIQYSTSAQTGVYFKDPGAGVFYYRNGSAAARAEPDAYSYVPFERSRIIHLTGITPALSAGCSEQIDHLVSRVRKSGSQLSFDVNFRPQLWKPEATHTASAAVRLRSIAQEADIVFVGFDEAQALWDVKSPDDIRELLPKPEFIVVKDGGTAAHEYHAGTITSVPAIAVDVVELVGAGDAFAAGYLQALLNGEEAPVRLGRGHERAVATIQDTADFPRR